MEENATKNVKKRKTLVFHKSSNINNAVTSYDPKKAKLQK